MITQTSAAATTPVSLTEAKLFLKMDDITEDDTLITILIGAAVQQVETAIGRCLINQTWTQTFTDWNDSLVLYRSKVSSISSVKYYDADGVLQTLSSSVYEVDGLEPSTIRLKQDQDWPVHDGRNDGIQVVYIAGYGASASYVPESLKVLVLIVLSWLYENRQGGDFPVNVIRSLASGYVVAHAVC